jgi:hypothetical protein
MNVPWQDRIATDTRASYLESYLAEGFSNIPVKLIYKSECTSNAPKAIAFDLDETIGSFSDFHSIWSRLEPEMKTQEIFNEIIQLYPEFLRVGIIPVLSYIRKKQQRGDCLPIYIYTNNQCQDVIWINQLIYYLEMMVAKNAFATLNAQVVVSAYARDVRGFCKRSGGEFPKGTRRENDPKQGKLFADPICAFKIRNQRIEMRRTTHEKTYEDFVLCSMLHSTNVCFIDDIYHEKMKHRRVYYIQPPPYIPRLSYIEVIDRFLESSVYKRLYPHRQVGLFRRHNENNDPIMTSIVLQEEQNITNKIMYYIREFFCMTSKRHMTQRKNMKIGRFSRKRRHTHPQT